MLNFISIVLIGTENAGNIGAVARVMKNFGLSHLILINPLANPQSNTAFGFAMHAKDVLQKAEIHSIPISSSNDIYHQYLAKKLKSFNVVIGTTAKGITYKNINRMPLFLTEFSINQFSQQDRIALVFGRESTGLTNEELQHMDFLLRIPTDDIYPTLNLSHAVGIILSYFYFQQSRNLQDQIGRNVNLAKKSDKDLLLEKIAQVINATPLPAFRQKRTLTAFKNILGRAIVTQKEFEYLRNFFRKILQIYENPDIYEDFHGNEYFK
ncbi:RNA methyltransferase [Candidatus Harpocratesius sp.]